MEAVVNDTGLDREKSEKVMRHVKVVGSAVAATSGGAAVAKGSKKAVLTAGTALVGKLSMLRKKAAPSEAEWKEMPPRIRVYGVYIGFSTREFAIRQVENEEGISTELWDTIKDTRIL